MDVEVWPNHAETDHSSNKAICKYQILPPVATHNVYLLIFIAKQSLVEIM